MVLIAFTLILIIASFPVQAQELIPYQNNPVITKEASHIGAVQPFVLRENNYYTLWYVDMASLYRIKTVKSSNGIDWFDERDTQVTNRQKASDPFVVFENDKYTLYFASSDFGNISLWQSISNDGVTFNAGSEKEILKADSSWEGTSLSCPSVIKENNLSYLFYSGSGSGNWGIGLATSTDGTNWQKCTNNPFIAPGASEHIIKYNGTFYLFFQSPSGLEVQQAGSLNGCDTIWTNRHIVNSALRDPSPIQVGNNLWLYGTLPNETGYHIGLAGNTTIEKPNYPIVIVPGMFASWNNKAILHNESVTYDAWKLNPAVMEYEALRKTLENMGRILNDGYFVFPYDWRAPLATTVNNLDQFINKNIWNTHPYLPVQLIGHSLGGNIAQLYVQKNNTKPIKNIATAGSPLLGAAQSYKPLAGGEIDRQNNLIWLAEKLILLLNKSVIENDKDTISRTFPVLKDLLPAFPYLKNESGLTLDSVLANSTVLNPLPTSFISEFHVGGSGHQTDAGYILGEQTPLDKLQNIYQDGHPLNSWQEDGDGVVLLKSSLNQITPAPQSNHGEIIFSRENIKVLLSSLNINVQDSDIPNGKSTQIFPAILAFIQSPATIEIEHNGELQKENEGMIWIQNAENGKYRLNVNGVESGEYTASVWLIGESSDKWFQFKKTTSNGSRNSFIISFNPVDGGNVAEYVPPSPTTTPSLTPSPTHIPTKTPSPTSKPIAKPTHKPIPTNKPLPTRNPRSLRSPHFGGTKPPTFILIIKNSIIKVFKFFIPGRRR